MHARGNGLSILTPVRMLRPCGGPLTQVPQRHGRRRTRTRSASYFPRIYGSSIDCIVASCVDAEGLVVRLLPAPATDGLLGEGETVSRTHRSASATLYRTNAERHEGQKRKIARAAELVSMV